MHALPSSGAARKAAATMKNESHRNSGMRAIALSLTAFLMLGCASSQANQSGKLSIRTKSLPTKSESVEEELPELNAAEMVSRGDAAMRRGELNLAIVEYVKALVEQPENAELLIKIGDAQRELGQYEIAERAYAEALNRNPESAAALEGMGLVLMNLKRSREAKEKLTAALAKEPKRWRSLNALGIMADLSGDLDAAKGYFSQALALEPRSSLVLNNLGYSFYLAGDLAQAMSYFEEAARADADNRKVWSNLALIYVRRQEFPFALDSFARVMPKPEALNAVGYLCMVTEQFTCANEYFQRAIKASPVYYSEAYANLSRVTLRMGSSNGTAQP